MRRTRVITVALAGLAGLGLGAAILAAMRPAAKAVGAAQAGGDDVPSAAPAQPVTENARAYDLTFRQEMAADQGERSRIAVRARLEITPRDAAGRDLVRVAQVVTEGDGLPAATDLETVFARMHDGTGRLEAFAFRDGISPPARDLLKAIAAAVQFTRPAAAADREWQATELDVGGRFASSYRRADDAHVERFQRRFLGNPDKVGPTMGMTLGGTTRFTFDGNGALDALDTQERAQLAVGKLWQLTVGLSVKLVRVGEAPADWRFAAGTLVREDVAVTSAKPQRSSAADRARLGGRTLADLRAQAQQTDGLPGMERVRARSQLQLDHAALIRLNPTVAIEIAERMKDAATSPSEVGLLAGSLAAAGTPEASHALAEVLGDAKQAAVRSQAAVALNVSTAHDQETLDALTKGMKDADPDIASTSTLALGSASRTLRNGGGSGAEAAEALANAYRDATNVDEQIAALRGIGNSGDSSLLPIVEEATHAADPDVQEAAVYALRFMDASAEPVLARALSSGLAGVRSVAVRAIEYRGPESMRGALEAALAREPNADIRDAITRLLARGA
jgi:hypothetical protein